MYIILVSYEIVNKTSKRCVVMVTCSKHAFRAQPPLHPPLKEYTHDAFMKKCIQSQIRFQAFDVLQHEKLTIATIAGSRFTKSIILKLNVNEILSYKV
jgi:hypothetical protein